MFTTEQRKALVKSCLIVLTIAFIIPVLVHADIPFRYNNENFFSLERHEQPVSFKRDGYGGFVGYTESGRMFRQFPILESQDIRLHRFEIDEAFFYISDRGIIVAPSDLMALSIYQSRVEIESLALTS